ncbi:hypothetical protein WJX79_008243 [Trebouxia sp. C0005]
MPWQLDAGVSLFPMSGEHVNHAHLGRLQEDWLARAQPSSLSRPSTDTSSSDPSKHSTHEGLTLKEKNRRAQRKFREKQKARMTQAESKASELAQQLKDLKAQKAAAESRNVVLEKVFELQGSHSTKARHDASGATSITSACSDQASTSGSSEPVPYGLSTQIYSPIDIDTMLEARSEAPLIQFSHAQLEALEWVDFVRLWKEYISRLAMCLVEANGDNDSPAGKRAEGIMEELVTFFCYLAASHPKKVSTFKYLNMEEGASPSSGPPDELWQNIARSVHFDEHQKAQICGIREYLLTNLSRIMKAREEISAQLVSAVPPQGGGGCNCRVATGHVQALQATEKLHQNLQQAQECLTQFQIAARECMTPLQSAMCCVQAFPWVPDVLAVFHCVAEAHNTAAGTSRDGTAGSQDLSSD